MSAPAGPRLWLIGCGNMAGAMLSRWIETGAVDPARVFVINRHDRDLPARVSQGRALPDGPLPDMVMLGVKPQQLDAVVGTHAARIARVPVLVSILAGVEEVTLAQRFDAGAILRAMPNLPVAIGKGVVLLHSNGAADAARGAVAKLMEPLGLVEWVDDAQFNAATALTGCGPAFLYRVIDALTAGAMALGVAADQAQRLALATVEGSALLAAQADASPAVLADRVASPGGSTRAGLDVLDHDDALVALLRATLAASARRNAEMAAAAR